MNEIVAQIICNIRGFLANGSDVSDWMQILVYIIIGVIAAIGSIAKKKKVRTEEQEETSKGIQRKTGRKPVIISSLLRKEPVATGRAIESKPIDAGRRSTTQPSLVDKVAEILGEKIEVIAEQTGQFDILEQIKKAKAMPETIQARPDIEPRPPQPPRVIATPAVEADKKGVPIAAEAPLPLYLSDILAIYSDPDELRKAILHYEILGKPLSLRESTENIL